jgi:queuine tRNA-ribosyltransferase
MHFRVLATDPTSALRVGVLETRRGSVQTPAFMAVGTRASVKGLTPDDVRSTGARVVLSNTYHLMQQPGIDYVERLGGLHAFMRWDGPMLTDSGGFQVFSLAGLREVTDEGVHFESLLLTPECVVDAQERLGADLIMPLDECVSADASREQTESALERTAAWWQRSLEARRTTDQALFALVQGGMFDDLRRQAARSAAATSPPGFALGGFSVGEPKELTAALLQATVDELPPATPRYLMGVGHPADVVRYARLGVDLFDSVLPTRLGRTGSVWCDLNGTELRLARRAALELDGPLRAGCTCVACTEWSIGSIAALFQSREQLAFRLASVHNLRVVADALHAARSQVVYHT